MIALSLFLIVRLSGREVVEASVEAREKVSNADDD